ncbi:carbohydrate kinase family protein [Filimonas effusa]|uniref:Carbohydrate kinase n=1 Tax=Filimonas effusa TaxID=2508721 RepID=A0A4Q1DAW9_9BACT|nr:carbohydrate kinase [Filimonas effusa]RXK85915.1 carbohydrate kinase [Filimonas effusa]
MNANPITITCFGEVLWDIFPTGRKAGGAPFNVAYHLNKLGVRAQMITRLGNDEPGNTLYKLITDWGVALPTHWQHSHARTGTVIATIDEHNEAHYAITEDVAWDYISTSQEDIAVAAASDVFVYGSLAARGLESRHAIFELLEAAPFKVFDINLRPPYYDGQLLASLLKHADCVKLNKAELRIILSIFGREYESEVAGLQFLEEQFDIHELLLTKGSKGAVCCSGGNWYECNALPVTVKDTVGSGDSFLAAYLVSRCSGNTVEDMLFDAAAMGAFVTTQEGACPDYTPATFEQFKQAAKPFFRVQQGTSLQPFTPLRTSL